MAHNAQPASIAWLSLGSNLGDRRALLRNALDLLAAVPGVRIVAESSIIETAPWGVVNQPAFLNMAAGVQTDLSPEDLLTCLKRVEDELGRQRLDKWGPRTVDLDIVVYESEERDTPTLKLPHPYATERRFVLEPLAEIAPDLCVRGRTIGAWLADCPDP